MSDHLRHTCPWPGCVRAVGSRYWGCEPHWLLLPSVLRMKFIKGQVLAGHDAAPQQPVAFQMVLEEIRNWLLQYAGVDGVALSTATEDLDCAFASGFTVGGQLLLFWPKAGEYLLLGPAEVAVLKRILRAA